jgi:hypothetical protein
VDLIVHPAANSRAALGDAKQLHVAEAPEFTPAYCGLSIFK